MSGVYADRLRTGQPLPRICLVTSVRITFSSWLPTQFVMESLLVTSTVPVRLVTSATGSVTLMEYSPKTRSVTIVPVCGSLTSSTLPPKG